MRQLARHIAGIFMGVIGGWLVTTLTGLGVPAEDVAVAVSSLEVLVTTAVFVLFYVLTEKGLKLVKSWFPGDWAEVIWKQQAATKVENLSTQAAKNKIQQGQV